MVSVMPCTAKSLKLVDDEDAAGVPDADYAITTKELASMIERAGIKFTSLPDEEFDMPRNVIRCWCNFGATGGVMEAA